MVINANMILNSSAPNPKTDSTTMHMEAGKQYAVEVNYFEDALAQLAYSYLAQVEGGNAMIRFGWVPPAGTIPPNIQAAVDAAKATCWPTCSSVT